MVSCRRKHRLVGRGGGRAAAALLAFRPARGVRNLSANSSIFSSSVLRFGIFYLETGQTALIKVIHHSTDYNLRLNPGETANILEDKLLQRCGCQAVKQGLEKTKSENKILLSLGTSKEIIFTQNQVETVMLR